MIRTEFLAKQPTLKTARTQLVPMGPRFFPQVWRSLQDREVARLTGTHASFTEEQVRGHLDSLSRRGDRADWAIVRTEDGSYLGEVVLNDLDRGNESMNYRIALRGLDVVGQGYGTEAGLAVINFGLGLVGLHRISLGVYAFNERAIKSYQKIGFEFEGRLRHALQWDRGWYDEIVMAILAPGALDESPDAVGSADHSPMQPSNDTSV
ncbi:aminoglycoside N(6')-acetyltransferase [Microlunatus endophyticus]|uniref:Aminoglycoside N(6')-acetyltransferase n=1 Tax=Microlunatus endophyticus TaxID=1716077 RepID=A0A917W1W6_9ACTN|nr:GNAT family protein [Microlunatus endophyticus]GGL52985.1 aminoglycoside N(6')-acetyltransferase [Microlunatus endophyticus]